MEFEIPLNLQGNEFLTTIFHPKDESLMILALGENTEMKKKEVAFVYLYLCTNGEVDHGIDTFVFFEHEKVQEFIENLPQMTALDFVLAGTGCQPKLY